MKARGKLLTCLASHKSAEPDTLVVRIDFEQRDGLLAEAPETYYLTDHYRDYPSVLVNCLGSRPASCETSWGIVAVCNVPKGVHMANSTRDDAAMGSLPDENSGGRCGPVDWRYPRLERGSSSHASLQQNMKNVAEVDDYIATSKDT